MRSRFVWADGCVEYLDVPDVPAWRRFRFRKELKLGCFDETEIPLLPEAEEVVFERVYHLDGSFSFREKTK